MRLKSLKQTCEACPSQWEGKLSDGRKVYIRYRWGTLTVHVGETKAMSIEDTVATFPIASIIMGSAMDGYLKEEDMLEMLSSLEAPKKSPAVRGPNGGKGK